MENSTITIKRHNIHLAILTIGFLSILVLFGVLFNYAYDKVVIKLENEQAKSEALVKHLNGSTRELDSLREANKIFEKYRALSFAAANRDRISDALNIHSGDILYLKPDSAKCYVTSIIEGGSDNEYYVKFAVQLEDGSARTVISEGFFLQR